MLHAFTCCTGSTISFWHRVKTWFDHMIWQIYQKLMLSGFLSSGNLCLIHYLKLFWPHTASTASDRKGAEIQHEFWWFCQKIFFLRNGSSKIQFFTNIGHPFWRRLLRLRDVKNVSNSGSGINFHYSGSISLWYICQNILSSQFFTLYQILMVDPVAKNASDPYLPSMYNMGQHYTSAAI